MLPFLRTAAPVDINYLIVRHKQTLVIDFKESDFIIWQENVLVEIRVCRLGSIHSVFNIQKHMHIEDLNLISFEFLCGYGCLQLIKIALSFSLFKF